MVTRETNVFLENGEQIGIVATTNLKNQLIKGFDIESKSPVLGKPKTFRNIPQHKVVRVTYTVEENGDTKTYNITCSNGHKFLLDNLTYKTARGLNVGMVLKNIDNKLSKVVKVDDSIAPEDVYGITVKSCRHMVVDGGIVLSDT